MVLRCKFRKRLLGIPFGDSPFCCQKGRKTTSNSEVLDPRPRGLRAPLETPRRHVARRISSRLQGRTCGVLLRSTPAMHNASTAARRIFSLRRLVVCDAERLRARDCGRCASHTPAAIQIIIFLRFITNSFAFSCALLPPCAFVRGCFTGAPSNRRRCHRFTSRSWKCL
jgi:hypothetical protein